MSKQYKKAAVKPDLRREWLRRFEAGASAPEIAKADAYDPRTVRRNIDLSRQERDEREAKSLVLRGALEEHYRDLYEFAGKLDGLFSRSPQDVPRALKDDRKFQALKAHLPRSPLWKALERWDDLAKRIDLAKEEVRKKAVAVANGKGFPEVDPADEGGGGLGTGFTDLIVFCVEAMIRDDAKAIKEFAKLVHGPFAGGKLEEVRIGAFGLGLLRKSDLSHFESMYSELIEAVPSWPEVKPLEDSVKESARVASNARDEIALLTMRRIVPGHCRYCPF